MFAPPPAAVAPGPLDDDDDDDDGGGVDRAGMRDLRWRILSLMRSRRRRSMAEWETLRRASRSSFEMACLALDLLSAADNDAAVEDVGVAVVVEVVAIVAVVAEDDKEDEESDKGVVMLVVWALGAAFGFGFSFVGGSGSGTAEEVSERVLLFVVEGDIDKDSLVMFLR